MIKSSGDAGSQAQPRSSLLPEVTTEPAGGVEGKRDERQGLGLHQTVLRSGEIAT